MIVCDRCSKEIEVELQVQELPNEIGRVFFVCAACDESYTAYYTDPSIRKKQSKIKVIQAKYRRANDTQAAKRLFKQIERLQREIKSEMVALRERMEGKQE